MHLPKLQHVPAQAIQATASTCGAHITPPWPCGMSCVCGWHLLTHHHLLLHCRLLHMLEWEGEAPVGGKAYTPEVEDPSEAGALASTLWELALLQRHYHPHVVQATASVAALAPGEGPAALLAALAAVLIACADCMCACGLPAAKVECMHSKSRYLRACC